MYFAGDVIRSRQNKNLVELCKLTDRKNREAGRVFRFDGIKLLEEAIAKSVDLAAVFLRESDAEKIVGGLQKRLGILDFDRFGKILVVADEVFDRISEEKSPEGVITIAKYIDKFQKNVTIYNSADFFDMKNDRIVLLESVRDPSNIGAVIRSAAALGIDRLIISRDCADIYHPRAVRASMGTLFDQQIDRVENLATVIASFASHGRRVFAATLDERAVRLGSFDVRGGDCVVIGNEGHGLSDAVIAACTDSVMIPMSTRAESFNAAVAASILMWEFAKQDIR
ncbi:MAG: RNA methyltransferase [Clostridia bacterium]|nr:RNA methyltransferase [Clostridia bacterium]